MELIKYDAMCTAIAECERVDEVKDIRDKAIAIEAYAKQAMNTEAERQACNIRLRAERKVGQMLKEVNPGQGGDRKSKDHAEPLKEYQQAKESAGISDTQAKRWQKLASVNNDEFESALSDPDEKPSTSGIIKKANGTKTKMDPVALWVWGRLRDFERQGVFSKNKSYLLGEMTDTMHADLDRIIPQLIDFLQELYNAKH